ncbi:MAG: hypothetical protein AAF823_03950 [Planctomycetota bacterium]
MRLWIDTLIALLLTATLAVVLGFGSDDRVSRAEVLETSASAGSIEAMVRYQAVMAEAADAIAGVEPQRLPVLRPIVDPAWFGERKPVNRLDDADRPWIDVAPPGDTGDHPPDPVLKRSTQAGFWFNPTTGAVRARVPMQGTAAATLELYNAVNAVGLSELPVATDISFDRLPMAMALPGEVEVTRASPEPASVVAGGRVEVPTGE